MVEELKIRELVEEKIEDTDIFIVEIKCTSNKIMVFVDKPAGITIKECSGISRHIINALEPSGELEINDLDVSSPGADMPFRVHPQYVRAVGRKVNITTENGEERTGVLKSVSEDGIEIEEIITKKEKNKKISETVTSTLPFSNIKETKVVISFK